MYIYIYIYILFIYIYFICILYFIYILYLQLKRFRSIYRNLGWVRIGPTTTEVRSDALTD